MLATCLPDRPHALPGRHGWLLKRGDTFHSFAYCRPARLVLRGDDTCLEFKDGRVIPRQRYMSVKSCSFESARGLSNHETSFIHGKMKTTAADLDGMQCVDIYYRGLKLTLVQT